MAIKLGFTFVILLAFTNCLAQWKPKVKQLRITEYQVKESQVTVKFPTYMISLNETSNYPSTRVKINPIQVACKNNVSNAVVKLKKLTRCMPREKIVTIEAPYGSTVNPSTVLIKKCDGMCAPYVKCVPETQRSVEFYVIQHNLGNNSDYCTKILVKEDVSCHCGCPLKKKCLKGQIMDKGCSCRCSKNKEKKKECESKMSGIFKWDTSKCVCGCKTVKPCTSGFVWNTETCQCVKCEE